MRPAVLLLLALVVLAAPAAAQQEEVVFEVVEQMPMLIGGLGSIQPVYPEMERRAGVQGRVFLQFIVNEDGSVSDIVVTRSVSPGLDAAAVAALRSARFTPGIQRGRPVKVRFSLPVNFRLLDDTLYALFDLPLRATQDPRDAILLRIPPGTALTPRCADGWCIVTYREYTGYVLEAGLSSNPPGPNR